MASGSFGESDSPEDDRFQVFGHLYLAGGWMRHLPVRAIGILMALAADGPLTFDELDAHLSARTETPGGLTSTAWEPLEEWTDARLRELDEQFPQFATHGEPQTAEQAIAEDRQERDAWIARMDAASAALGAAPVRTMADLLEFMVACTVLTAAEEQGQTRYALNPHAALPAEVLPLSSDDRAAEDKMRWEQLHAPIAQRIIGLFRPDNTDRPDVLRTSVRRLADELGVDTETARASLAVLLQAQDFTADCDPERVSLDEILEIRVDWRTFDQARISIQLADPPSG